MESKNSAMQVAGFIFFLVAILHLLRIITEAPVTIAGWLLPVWVNYLGFLGAGFLCVWLWKTAGRNK